MVNLFQYKTALNEPEIFNFEVQCSLNDGSRSSVNAVQTGLTNHSTVLLGWLSGVERLEKRHGKTCQVRIGELNASEPLMKCRENALSVKTCGGLRTRRSVADICLLATWQTSQRRQESYLGIWREQRKSYESVKRKAQVQTNTRLNIDIS